MSMSSCGAMGGVGLAEGGEGEGVCSEVYGEDSGFSRVMVACLVDI